MTDGKTTDLRGQSIRGLKTNLGKNDGTVLSGIFYGTVNVESSDDSNSTLTRIPNVTEHLLRLSKLREWKDMHTETQVLLNIMSNLVMHIAECEYKQGIDFDRAMKSASDDWWLCSPLLLNLRNTMASFHHISPNDHLTRCLEHTNSVYTITHMITDAKTAGNATSLGILIGAVRSDFEAALLIADRQIAHLVNELASEILKNLGETNNGNERT